MFKAKLFSACLVFTLCTSTAGYAETAEDPSGFPAIESVTVEGGPIATKHFQSGDENYRERHGLVIAKVATEDYGTWGLYFLNPNSVEETSVGAGYVSDPFVVPLGPTQLELTGAIGLVTGYQDYPMPLVAGEARLPVYESGPWNAGIAFAVMPYLMEDNDTGDTEGGVVVTTPFLSVRYKFN